MENFSKESIFKGSIYHLDRVLEIESESFDYPWTDKSRFLTAGELYIYKRKENISGYLLFNINNKECRIIKIATSTKDRRAGGGKIILDWLKKHLKSRGVKKITLNVRESNKSAINFYVKNRFSIKEEIKGFYTKSTHESSISMEYFIE